VLRSIHDPERGAGYVEYGAVILLVAAIAATVIGSGITGRVQQMITGAVDSVGQPQAGADAPERGGDADGPDGSDGQDASDVPGPQGAAPQAPGDAVDPAPQDTGTDTTPAFVQATTPSFAPLGLDNLLPGVDAPSLSITPTGGWRSGLENFADAAAASQERVTDEGMEMLQETLQGPVNLAEDLWQDPTGTVRNGLQGAANAVGTEIGDYFGAGMRGAEQAAGGFLDGDPMAVVEGLTRFPLYNLTSFSSALISEEAMEHFAAGEIEEGLVRSGVTLGSLFIGGPAGRIALGGVRLVPQWTGSSRDPDGGSDHLADGADGPPNGEGNGTQGNDGEGFDPDEDPEGLSCTPGNSFLPGTPVLLADGTTAPIEDVAVGEEVLAFDPLTGEEGPREVTDTITGDGTKTLVTITIDTGDGTTGTLTATDEHPFWVPDQAAWVDAIDLTPGTWLRTSTGTWTQITAVDVHETPDQRVHNLTIADLHTYYVGVDGVDLLVHNDNESSCPDWLRDRLEAGNDFNREREGHYTELGGANEVHVGPRTSGNQYQRVDSYIPGEEIVSRKYTQLAEIQESTAFKYLRELARDYPPGTVIADTPTNRDDLGEAMIGTTLDGDMILEVPVQNSPVPESVLREAERLDITIRDADGNELA
jgi:Flp pilus assembly pilin Flp